MMHRMSFIQIPVPTKLEPFSQPSLLNIGFQRSEERVASRPHHRYVTADVEV